MVTIPVNKETCKPGKKQVMQELRWFGGGDFHLPVIPEASVHGWTIPLKFMIMEVRLQTVKLVDSTGRRGTRKSSKVRQNKHGVSGWHTILNVGEIYLLIEKFLLSLLVRPGSQ